MVARTEIPLMTETFKANGTIVADRFITGPQSATVQTGAGLHSTGVAKAPAASGEYFPGVTQGVTIVEAGGTLADDALVEADASGRAITRNAGVALGRTIGTATVGQPINIRLIVN